jgi:mono/diheme cytochrome c family protein
MLPMRNVLLWFLVAAFVLFLLACNKGGSGSTQAASQSSQSQASKGEDIFAVNRCATCHGDNLEGKPNLGPALVGLSANWDVEKLDKYLANPPEYTASDPRLSEQKSKYAMKMPVFSITDADRRTLAEWLLKK